MTAVYVEEGPDQGAIWHFGEPNKEQKALHEGKAWADLSHLSVIAVSGEDGLKWLHDVTTQYLFRGEVVLQQLALHQVPKYQLA